MAFGTKVILSASLDRPGDTTAYAEGDQVCAAFDLGPCPAGGYVVGGLYTSDNAADASTYRIHLFKADPGGGGDNAPIEFGVDNYLGYFGLGDTSFSTVDAAVTYDGTIRVPVWTASHLWALVECRTAFTPASGASYTLTLAVEAD